MYCRNCGKELSDKAEFCTGCGVRPSNGRKYCNNCGVETNENQEICLKCGVRLASSTSIDTSNELVMIILCIFLPPVAVWLKTKHTGKVLLNIILSFFVFWIGGVLHALIVKQR